MPQIRWVFALALVHVLGCGSGNGGGHASVDAGADAHDAASPFVEFAWRTDTPDPSTERLCAESSDPDNAPDTTFIDCAIEGATFATAPAEPQEEIVVLAYNILRGFQADAQLDVIISGEAFPTPDILLLSEVDRGCRRTNFRNIARDYAERLGYYYVYATEFVELPSQRGNTGPYDPPLCEHGNAIVSRFPLGNVRQIRHAQNRSWYTPPKHPDPDEPRLGGRIAIAADARVGTRLVRLYVLHLESTVAALDIRDAQAEEIATDAQTVAHPVIAGGDLNTFLYATNIENDFPEGSKAIQAFIDRGFSDAHASLELQDRYTNFDPFPMVIDLVLAREATVVAAGRCEPKICSALSDHLPVFATLRL